jgi:hypothetical protein
MGGRRKQRPAKQRQSKSNSKGSAKSKKAAAAEDRASTKSKAAPSDWTLADEATERRIAALRGALRAHLVEAGLPLRAASCVGVTCLY